VLAPMAGVTNVAFRTLCRELEFARAGTVSGLYVCEMVTARALVERHPATMHMVTFAEDESPRSLQLSNNAALSWNARDITRRCSRLRTRFRCSCTMKKAGDMR